MQVYILPHVVLKRLIGKRSYNLGHIMLLNETNCPYRPIKFNNLEKNISLILSYERHGTEYHTSRTGKLLQETHRSLVQCKHWN